MFLYKSVQINLLLLTIRIDPDCDSKTAKFLQVPRIARLAVLENDENENLSPSAFILTNSPSSSKGARN